MSYRARRFSTSGGGRGADGERRAAAARSGSGVTVRPAGAARKAGRMPNCFQPVAEPSWPRTRRVRLGGRRAAFPLLVLHRASTIILLLQERHGGGKRAAGSRLGRLARLQRGRQVAAANHAVAEGRHGIFDEQ